MTILMKPVGSLQYADLPPEAPHPKWYPHLDHNTVNVPNCYYYVSFLEKFWHTMDDMTNLEQRHFLARAEVRYEQWIRNFNSALAVPPLDVAFMWHVHLLSPFHCYEDLVLRLPGKEVFDTPFPLAELRGSPSASTVKAWEAVLGDEPYTLTKDNMYSGVFHRSCYKCGDRIELPWTTYFDQRYGLDLNRFSHGCDASLASQGIHVMDLAKLKLEADLLGNAEGRSKIAGTLLNPDGTEKTEANKMVSKLKPIQVFNPENEVDYAYERQIQEQLKFLGDKYEYDANELLYAIRSSYHGNPSPFSIDLIHAVARQRKFYHLVMLSDWHDSDVLSSSVRRYHDFMFMMKANPTMIAVPTVGIDVAFHTHMIHGASYRAFTLKHLKRVINHDNGIPLTSLKEYAIETNQAWQVLPMRYFYAVRNSNKPRKKKARITHDD
ncbi:hypothetical protein BCR42DRAFT_145810 [Absidia repens]|uniref:Uncharacterized protein n=1 Tax=Absidia repens TaxID=90262 RepID=A0A1X2I2Q2_9FUNG|nr:hypothetical protein BCR42DRAFT_145810 [Absidia repens]